MVNWRKTDLQFTKLLEQVIPEFFGTSTPPSQEIFRTRFFKWYLTAAADDTWAQIKMKTRIGMALMSTARSLLEAVKIFTAAFPLNTKGLPSYTVGLSYFSVWRPISPFLKKKKRRRREESSNMQAL